MSMTSALCSLVSRGKPSVKKAFIYLQGSRHTCSKREQCVYASSDMPDIGFELKASRDCEFGKSRGCRLTLRHSSRLLA
jgi:hypothetical protein